MPRLYNFTLSFDMSGLNIKHVQFYRWTKHTLKLNLGICFYYIQTFLSTSSVSKNWVLGYLMVDQHLKWCCYFGFVSLLPCV